MNRVVYDRASGQVRIEPVVNCLQPILCRPGGKKLLKKIIVNRIPSHKTYVEPFLGTGAVFFEKPLAEKNILGDNDRDLMDFYKKAQKQNKMICDLRRDKNKFNHIKNKRSSSPCDYVYLTKMSFGCTGKSYNEAHSPNSFQEYNKQINMFKNAKLIQGDYRNLIKNYDSKDTFFYLDPPYHETSCSYPDGSCSVKPKEILDSVKNIKGKFILSYNNHPEIRKLFCDKYKCDVIKTRYTSNNIKDSSKQARQEILIKNF